MYDVSPLFLHTIPLDQDKVSRVDAESGLDRAVTVEVQDTSVTSNLDDTVRSSADVALHDPTGILVPESTEDLLSAFSARIRPYRGLRFADGTEELVPLGRFQPTDTGVRREKGGTRITLKCLDEAGLAQRELEHPVAIEAGMGPDEAIARIITALLPTATFRLTPVAFELPALLIREKSIAWNEAVDIARSAGCDLYFDRLGVCTMDPRPLAAKPVSDGTDWEFVEGERGTHFDIERSERSDNKPNKIIVVGTHSAAPSIQAEAADEEPTSPTYVRGGYGGGTPIVKFVESPLVGTLEQAQAMATGLLSRVLGPSDEVTFSAVPNPALDLGDTVAITSPSLKLVERRMLVTQITMPLGAEESMDVTCRRSILTVDDVWPVRGET